MIKTAIVGLGKMGLSHCAILNANSNNNMVAVCDTSSFVLETFKKYTDKKVYTNFDKMLNENELDGIIIATPTKFHYPMVKEVLNRGINVFCEKPFTLKASEAEELKELATSKNLVNQVGYHNRFIGTFNEVKRLLAKNIIGDIYHFQGEAYGPVVLKEQVKTWRSQKGQGGGCLYDYSSHVINLINFLFGDIEKVRGSILKSIFSLELEDAVYSNLYLQNGISGQLLVNWSEPTYRKMSTSITIWGKKGKIISDASEMRIYLNEENKEENLLNGWNIKYITDLTPPVNFYLRGEEYSSQIDYFIERIINKESVNVNSFEESCKTDKVIDMILKDAREV